MALDIVNLLAKRLKQQYGLTFDACATKHLPISGGDVGGSKNFNQFVEQKSKKQKHSISMKMLHDVLLQNTDLM